MATLSEAFEIALRRHQAGQLQDAERIYRQILEADPHHADSLHYLGVIAYQVGKPQTAVDHIGRAIASDPHNPAAHANLGVAYQALGRHDEAVSCFRRALEIEPECPEAHYNLGITFYDQAKLDDAAACYQRALELRPDYAEAHSNLGLVRKDRGKLKQAMACYQRALQIRPNYPEPHNNLGVVFKDQGKADEAVACYRRALQLKPDYVEAHTNLGVALKEQGSLDQAVSCFQRALQIRPDYARAHKDLGIAFYEQGRLDDAVDCCRRALEINPDYAEAHNALGGALNDLGRLNQAVACFRRALEIKPDFAEAHQNLGGALVAQGNLKEGVEHFRTAITLKPAFARAYLNLSKSKRFSPGDRAEIEAIENLLAGENLPCQSQVDLHYAMGKIYDDLQNWDQAFAHYQKANQLARVQFDERQCVAGVEALIRTFTRALLADKCDFGHPSDVPVFIVGMPRSGTTLVEQILASHPAVFGAGELDEMGKITASMPSVVDSHRSYPQCTTELTAQAADQLGERYLDRLRAPAPGAIRVIDKMPTNFLHMGLIALLLPKARIVHCRRHPLDTCISCYFQHFRARLAFAYDLHNVGVYHRHYETLMDHWRAVLPLPMFELDYEELVQDQEQTSRRLFEFCGLEWHPGCLDFHKTPRPVQTAANWQVRQPIYTHSVGRWKHYEKFLEPLKRALGYRPN